MFSSSSFTVSGLTFKSLIFESIFIYGLTQWPDFILLHVDIQYFQDFAETKSFLLCIHSTFVKNELTVCAQVYIQVACSVPFISMFVLCVEC